MSLALLSYSCGDSRPLPGQEVPAPDKISVADAEAMLAAREVFTPVEHARGRNAAARQPAGDPSEGEGSLTLSARLLDEEAIPLANGRLAWIVIEDILPVEKIVASSQHSGAVWLEIPRAELPPDGPLMLVAGGPGRVRQLLRLERSLWADVPVLSLNEVLLSPGGSVSGRVVDSNARPIEGAFVGLGPELGELTDELRAMARLWPLLGSLGAGVAPPLLRTDSSGRFSLEEVPTGLFMVVACPWPSEAPRLVDRVSGVRVLPGEETSIRDLVLREPSPHELILGRVESPDGEPISGARVSLGDPGRDFARTRSAADGGFALLAPAGQAYRLSAQDNGGRWLGVELTGVEPGGPSIVLSFSTPRPPPRVPDGESAVAPPSGN